MKLKETLGKIRRELKKFQTILKGEKSVDKICASQHFYPTEEAAIKALDTAKRKLFHVNSWNVLSGPENAKFILHTSEGNPYRSPIPRIDDYIKIILPGPFPANWVQVVNVKEEENVAEFTVRPSEDPESEEHTTKHFFKSKATSTFRVERKGRRIKAYEIGKEEEINNNTEEAGKRSVVNTVVAQGGWAGFQKVQWKNLTEFLVKPE